MEGREEKKRKRKGNEKKKGKGQEGERERKIKMEKGCDEKGRKMKEIGEERKEEERKKKGQGKVERKTKGTERGIVKDFHHKSVATNMETLQGAGGLRPLQLSQPFRGSFNFADLSRNSGPQTCQFSTTKSSVWNFRRTQLSLNLCPSSEILAEEKN